MIIRRAGLFVGSAFEVSAVSALTVVPVVFFSFPVLQENKNKSTTGNAMEIARDRTCFIVSMF
jgi:hypothetical protein